MPNKHASKTEEFLKKNPGKRLFQPGKARRSDAEEDNGRREMGRSVRRFPDSATKTAVGLLTRRILYLKSASFS
jgi:hypothetical protein